jgi:hypothetical protein
VTSLRLKAVSAGTVISSANTLKLIKSPKINVKNFFIFIYD